MTTLADERVVAVLELADEVVRIGRDRSRHDLVLTRTRHTVANVLGDRAEKQVRILQHHAELVAITADVQVAQVYTIDGDAAASHVVEPRN